MWNRLRFIRFLQVSQIFQRRKSDTNKQDFENKLNLTCHAQSTPKTTGFLTKVFSTSGPNLVALAWTVDELSREQAQNGVNFDFEVKFDLEGQGQSPPKTIGILTKVFYTYGPNLVILAWTGDELSRGQTWWRTDWRTDGRTDAGNDNTRRPILASGKNWDILNCAINSPNVHWWANKARSWLLRTLTFRIIWIYPSICQRLSLPLYNTHPPWLSLTNELKFVD